MLTFDIQSAYGNDVYNNCHFKVTIEGGWRFLEDYERLAITGRRITSLTGSTCTNPPVSDLTFATKVALPGIQSSSRSLPRILITPTVVSPIYSRRGWCQPS